jgi:CheY-like chemotaxis protein
VLVVDDDAMVGTSVVRALSRECDVAIVGSAAAAMGKLEAGAKYDVIICDLMMPVATGMDLYQEVASKYPAIAARMIFLTGGAFTEGAREFLQSVSSPCLSKPISINELRAAVRKQAER